MIHQEKPFLYLCSNEYPVPPQDPQARQWQTWLRLRPDVLSLPELFRTTSLRCGTIRRGTRQVETSGVFLQAARFNSSCQPNVHAHWNQREGYMDFRALRNIAADEELCICYDPPTLLYSSAERQQRLLTKFGFSCVCPPCSQENLDSDRRRTDLRRIIEVGVPNPSLGVEVVSTRHSSGNDQTDDPKALNCIDQITGAIRNLHAEDIYNYADTLHFDLHLARKQAGQLSNAMLCLLTARNLTSMMIGSDDPRVGQLMAKLPSHLCDDSSLTCRAEGCRVGESLDNSLPPDGL